MPYNNDWKWKTDGSPIQEWDLWKTGDLINQEKMNSLVNQINTNVKIIDELSFKQVVINAFSLKVGENGAKTANAIIAPAGSSKDLTVVITLSKQFSALSTMTLATTANGTTTTINLKSTSYIPDLNTNTATITLNNAIPAPSNLAQQVICTLTLTELDGGGEQVSTAKTITLSYGSIVYYGFNSTEPGNMTDTIAKTLSKTQVLTTKYAGGDINNPANGNYFYYITPTRFGTKDKYTFKSGGNPYNISSQANTITIENDYGATEAYYIFHSANSVIAGSYNITVS